MSSSNNHGGARTDSGRRTKAENIKRARAQDPLAKERFINKHCISLSLLYLIPTDTADAAREIVYIGDPNQPFESVKFIRALTSYSRKENSLGECNLIEATWDLPTGDSLVMSTAHFLCGEAGEHDEVRRNVIRHIRKHPPLYRTIIHNETGLSVEHYCTKMEHEGEAAGAVFVVAISIIYDITMQVFHMDSQEVISRVETFTPTTVDTYRGRLQISLIDDHYALIAADTDSDPIFWDGITYFFNPHT